MHQIPFPHPTSNTEIPFSKSRLFVTLDKMFLHNVKWAQKFTCYTYTLPFIKLFEREMLLSKPMLVIYIYIECLLTPVRRCCFIFWQPVCGCFCIVEISIDRYNRINRGIVVIVLDVRFQHFVQRWIFRIGKKQKTTFIYTCVAIGFIQTKGNL